MSHSHHSAAADRAMDALRRGDADQARSALIEALAEGPDRIDLLHALAITELRLGDPRAALEAISRAELLADAQRDEGAAMMMPQIMLAKAAAAEDIGRPAMAEVAYRELLEHEPDNPRSAAGLAHLLLAWGRLDEGMTRLDAYLEASADEPQFLDAARGFLDALRRFRRDDVHPRELLNAHRGAYVEFFDENADRLEQEGWIAEAAHMHRDEQGRVVPVIPEGARPYAGVRVDLVNPATSQPGRVGPEPMMVALAGYEALAQAPVLVDWPAGDVPYPVWVSTQAPWNHLPIQIRFAEPIDADEAADPTIGDWYGAGFNGAFGTPERGRLHEISDPEIPTAGTVIYYVDCGRAEVRAVEDLMNRLAVLHGTHALAALLIGRGHPPET